MRSRTTIRAGGVALIGGALAFMAVFAFLAARFNYPAVLDGNADQVLPSLLSTGAAGRAVWAIYGFLPLIWIPAAVGAFEALRDVREGSMRVALMFAVVSALCMTTLPSTPPGRTGSKSICSVPLVSLTRLPCSKDSGKRRTRRVALSSPGVA